jgi:hypothetical protein
MKGYGCSKLVCRVDVTDMKEKIPYTLKSMKTEEFK